MKNDWKYEEFPIGTVFKFTRCVNQVCDEHRCILEKTRCKRGWRIYGSDLYYINYRSGLLLRKEEIL